MRNLRERMASGRVLVMGIVNATPDSFYEGSRRPTAGSAAEQAGEMIRQGADIIDIGGESTRPGAEPVSEKEEINRVTPVIEQLFKNNEAVKSGGVLVSVDTCKQAVARAAVERGAGMINDISGLRHDPAMAQLAAEKGVSVAVMHMQGTPRDMQTDPHYADVVAEITEFFRERLAALEAAGVRKEDIVLDPGIGFGKTTRHNLEILARLKEFAALGCPVMLGTSRKSFIGRILGGEDTPVPPEGRLEGSIATHVWAAQNGAGILRVHDVKQTRDALAVLEGIQAAGK